jgi:predicted Fe-Mo cluster-binding NifX family protein
LSEEVEALYLMDLLELYQEEAAAKMEVSRPTFARIIKSARNKVALALLGGHTLHLESTKERYVVAVCSENEAMPYSSLSPKSRYIHFFTLENHHISEHRMIPNPLTSNQMRPSLVLTELFVNQRVNVFVTGTIGQGFKSNLSTKGIPVLLKEAITEEEIEALW